MTEKQLIRSAGRGLAWGTGLAAGAYAGYLGTIWLRDHVKSAWTSGAEVTGAAESVAGTETRAVATHPIAGRRFWRYWSVFWPGTALILRVALRLVKEEAERRAREGRPAPGDRFDLVSSGDLDAEC